ncbi:apoptotic chromatin condensation inducer in the nucleus-like isoform X2 [Lineus longissimus]|uniref:apoptotic chromatin condensation inducer in the nucleus-like isoform X2 n=1 Tax=Lineus longissimus TaxID=88925 RepID=UPI002B4EEEAC
MADGEAGSLVLGGRPIGELRVADLKKELEGRGLSKTGVKKELVQRLSESLLKERGSESGDDSDGHQERGRKQNAGRGHSSSRSSSGSSSSGSESRSRSRSIDDKSSSSSDSESRSRSRSASSSSSSAPGSPSPKKQSSSKKMEKPGRGVDNGTSRVEEMKESSAQRSPLKLKIRMDMASPERSHVETVVPLAFKEKKKEPKAVEKQAPEPSKPEADTTKDEKQPKVEEEDMDVGSPQKEKDVEVESPKRRISIEDSQGDKRITVDSSKEDQQIAVTSVKDDRRIVQEKEEDESNDSQPNSTTTDVLDVKETDEIERKEEDLKQEPRPPRKRRWGGRKVSPKRQISISSESLKGLIPDVKPILAVDTPAEVEVVKEEAASDHEKEDGEAEDDGDDDDEHKDMKIRRTVTQVVSSEDRREVLAEEDHLKVQEDMEIPDVEPKVKSPPQIIRKLSRSKPLVVADEPQKARRSPSPPKHPTSRVIHIRNLVRPFTLRQLKELLERTGKLTEGGFWIDKIKSHCLVMYETDLDASKTRQALHNTKWPLSNPKNLSVDFSTEAELENFQDADKPIKREVPNEAAVRDRERERREKERDMDQRNRREPPIERRPSGREWDRAKVVQRSPSPRVKSRDRSRSREPKRQPKESRVKERKERKEKKVQDEEPPAKLLDDLFRKTKATPSVYWLPLTEQQALEGERRRIQEALDRDKRRQELEERMHAERKKREMERLDRRKREQMAEREREKERERTRRHSRSRSRERRRR